MAKDSEFYKFAEKQLCKVGMFDDDEEYPTMIANAVLELIDTFDNQNHSGFSASWTLKIFSKLANWEELD